MTRYMVLIPDNEDAWEASSAEEKAAMYARHREFAELLAERGHKVTAGAELTRSNTAHIVSGTRDDVVVTQGPYAEAAEQLTGFYLIESDDLEPEVTETLEAVHRGRGANVAARRRTGQPRVRAAHHGPAAHRRPAALGAGAGPVDAVAGRRGGPGAGGAAHDGRRR